ncbi:MAG: hypothetical protein JNL28_03165 [Planctomycetes bacterium]|nr:hypothetical protein [Planctomycetota bacterium]
MIRNVLAAWTALAVYGFALGIAHSATYAVRNVLKFPLLVTVTAVVCSLSWWILARAVGAPLSFVAVQRTAWRMFRDLGFLLASLSPIVLFFALVMRATDDGVLGEYDRFLALNIVLIAVSGVVALARGARALFVEHALAPARVVVVMLAWLAVSATVGGQAAFFMRPFFGFPATRGGNPPFFLGAAPDLRGATNFFEAVQQTISRPPLPESLRPPDPVR